MSGRRQKVRDLKPGIYIVGEGITEQYYFDHIKRILDLNCWVKPRFFGNTSISGLDKRIEKLLSDDVFIICVFDADVSQNNIAEKAKLLKLQKKYAKNSNVLLCDSLPSIEFWFLIHFIDTNRKFQNSYEAEKLLRTCIPDYQKTKSFLEKEKWVIDLCKDGKLEKANERAIKYSTEEGSYCNIYKAFELLSKSKRI